VDNFACDTTVITPPQPQEPEHPQLCDLFPQPVQSWITNGTQDYSAYGNSQLNVYNDTVKINGFSDDYLLENIFDHSGYTGSAMHPVLRTGFDQVQPTWLAYDSPDASICQGIGCYPDDEMQTGKVAPPPVIPYTFDATQDVSLNDTYSYLRRSYTYQRVCDSILASDSLCTYETGSNNRVDITLQKDVRNLTLRAYDNNKYLVLHFKGDVKVEHLVYEGDTALYFDADTTVNFTTITSGNNAVMAFESGAWINISDAAAHNIELQMNANMRFYYVGESEDGYQYPVFYGPRANFLVRSDQAQDNGIYKGYLLAKEIELTGGTRVDGAVTAHNLVMSGTANIQTLNGGNQCHVPVDNNFELQITPIEDYALSCKKQTIQLQVRNPDGTPASDFSGSIYVSPANGLSVVPGSGGTGSDGLFQPDNNGLLQLQLTAGQAQDVQISAYLSTQSAEESVKGTYHFVPYAFSVDPQAVIANKPQSVNLRVLACDDDGQAIDIGYNGTPTVTSQWKAPAAGQGALTLSDLDFVNGEATAQLTMTDTGIQQVTLEDENFNCSQYQDCPIKSGGSLKGSFDVYSRPWTFAICPVDNTTSMEGNLTEVSSPKFAAAGDDFGVLVKPLKWSSGGKIDGAILSHSELCALPMIDNFFDSDPRLASQVSLTHTVAAPSGGVLGKLQQRVNSEQGIEITTTDVSLANTEGDRSHGIWFDQLSWSEVGVLQLTAQTKGNAGYILPNHIIQSGYRDIGRFVPHHLTLVSNEWNYSQGYDGFAYMGQPIEYGFVLEARNKQQQITRNYAQFPAALISDLSLYAKDGETSLLDRINTPRQTWDGGSNQWDSGRLSVAQAGFTFEKKLDSEPDAKVDAGTLVTLPDGPYQSGFGIAVSQVVDGVMFADSDVQAAFITQPDFRYGRLQLADVGGNSGDTITVPVEAQYWDGQRFAINDADSGSQFATQNELGETVCRQSVWSDRGDEVSLAHLEPLVPNTVDDGVGEGLAANASDNSHREQVRFWMRVANNSVQLNETDVACEAGHLGEPWLQFNWRGLGDEDPSTLITFGVYRGNDRIIYRGEPRINN
ncbi:MAG: DUF6701 domain-containing protein, partial [Vibrio sp.]